VARKIEPLGDRILVKALPEGEVVRGGIILPDTAKEKPQEGEVVAVGPGRMTDDGKRIPLDIKAGDRVIYAKYGGTEIKDGKDELLILRETDVLAKISSK
jgi:chaperonin GroES